MASKSVLIFGASGRVGSELLRQLVIAAVPVAAAVRDPIKAASKIPSGVRVYKADLNDPASVSDAVTESKAKSAFIYSQPGGMKPTIDALVASGITHIVFLSLLWIDKFNDALTERHAAVEKTLKVCGVTYTILRCGSFAANTTGWKTFISKDGIIKTAFPNASYPGIAEEDTAAVAVRAFTSHELDNQIVPLVGPEAQTFREKMKIIAQELGKHLEMVQISEDEHRNMMVANTPLPVVNAIFNFLRDVSNTPGDSSASANVLKYTGRPAMSYRQYVQKHKAEYTL